MIKATELRLGNMLYDSCGNIGDVIIDQGRFMIATDERGYVSIQECAPILLTSEWLLKCEINDRQFVQVNPHEIEDKFTIRVNEANISICFVTDTYGGIENKHIRFKMDEDTIYLHKPIQYVHQLQNLYYTLTGEELEIK